MKKTYIAILTAAAGLCSCIEMMDSASQADVVNPLNVSFKVKAVTGFVDADGNGTINTDFPVDGLTVRFTNFEEDAVIETLTDENGVRTYDKHCLHLSKEEIEENLKNGVPYVIRQNIPKVGTGTYHDMVYGDISVDYSELEDNILIKSDGMPTYNFANVVDDHLMKITHVIRGVEYLSSTPKYNLIYDAFGWERPQYMHLPPIMKDASHKLSKRYGDANFEDFINKGFLPEAIINYISLLGWSPKDNTEKMSMEELIEKFAKADCDKPWSDTSAWDKEWANDREWS